MIYKLELNVNMVVDATIDELRELKAKVEAVTGFDPKENESVPAPFHWRVTRTRTVSKVEGTDEVVE
jgi:hypothetical protein